MQLLVSTTSPCVSSSDSFGTSGPCGKRCHVDPVKELTRAVQKLLQKYPPKEVDRVDGGFYHGVCGIVLLLYTLKTHKELLPASFLVDLDSACDSYYQVIKNKRFVDPRGGHCGIACDYLGQLTLRLLYGEEREQGVAQLIVWARDIANDFRSSNEWLYGRAGFLYYIRLLIKELPADYTSRLREAAGYLIGAILQSPRPWTWHDTVYVGAAHGTIGIITQILLTDPNQAQVLESEVLAILALQLPSGNWPSSVESPHDRLFQFCHGAPGIAVSLRSLRPIFANDPGISPSTLEAIDQALERSSERFVERSSGLRKEACLCHGAAGNALACPRGDEQLWILRHARERYIDDHADSLEFSSARASLYSGMTGRIWTWFVVCSEAVEGVLGYNEWFNQ